MSEATGLTLNDSLDEDIEYDSMGLEVQNSALNTKVSSGDSSDPVNQNILGKLIKEKSIAIMTME